MTCSNYIIRISQNEVKLGFLDYRMYNDRPKFFKKSICYQRIGLIGNNQDEIMPCKDCNLIMFASQTRLKPHEEAVNISYNRSEKHRVLEVLLCGSFLVLRTKNPHFNKVAWLFLLNVETRAKTSLMPRGFATACNNKPIASVA